jgi:hypothetical protein
VWFSITMKNKWAYRSIVGVFLGLVGLFMLPGGVLAGILWEDTFDTLNLGALDGQNGWYNGGNLIEVQNTNYFSTPQAIQGGGTNGAFSYKDFSTITDGYVDYEIYLIGNNSKTGFVNVRSPGGWVCGTTWSYTNPDGAEIWLQNGADSYTQKFTELPLNNWYRIQFELKYSDKTNRVRYSDDGGSTWSAWSSYESCMNEGTGVWATSLTTRFIPSYFIDNIIMGSGSAPDSDEPPAPAQVKTLNFLQPLNNASTPDFSNYLLNYQYYTGTTTPVSLLFSINAYTDLGTFFGNSFIVQSVVPDSTTTKSIFIPKNFAFLQNKWYYANAFFSLVFPGDTFLATSTTMFVVSTTSSAVWQVPPTSTSTGLVLTCDPDSVWYVNSLCKLANFLFIPGQADLSQFSETWDGIKTKAPLGYLTSAITSLQELNTEGTASFSFSSLGEITDTIHDFFVSAFWLLFLFWAFNRIRHLNI